MSCVYRQAGNVIFKPELANIIYSKSSRVGTYTGNPVSIDKGTIVGCCALGMQF